jgi:LCP family protein required for cell wall assembly
MSGVKVAFFMRKLKKLMLILLLLVLAAGGYYGYAFYDFFQTIQQPNVTGKGAVAREPQIPVWSGTERVNILLMGVDRRGMRPNELPRSDSMIVVSIDPVHKRFDLFSILRDTYVNIPGYGRSRVNAALGEGGPELAMQTVSDFTGLPIDRYVITDFEGFKQLVDAVGGVELEVEKDMRYRDPSDKGVYDIDLKKGWQRLDGNKALQYVRFRHDAMSDYTRTERQRKFLTALAAEMKSGTTLLQLPSILKSITPYVETNISSLDMLKLAALGLALDTEHTGQYQLPPMGAFRESHRGGSVLIPDVDRVQQYVREKLQPASDTQTQAS